MTPLLFLHGAPGDARVWTPVIDRLPPTLDARAMTFSLFGQREAPAGGETFGTERHADDIIAFIENEMNAPVVMVAWSYAVHPALLSAIWRPDLFSALWLHEPGLPTYVTNAEAMAAFEADAPGAFGPIGEALHAKGSESAVEALLDSSGGQGTFADLSAERREIYLDSAGMMPLLMGGGQPPAHLTAEDVAQITCPVVVGLGENSRDIFVLPSRALAEALPNATLRIIDHADHLLPERDPARFALLVLDWLELTKAAA